MFSSFSFVSSFGLGARLLFAANLFALPRFTAAKGLEVAQDHATAAHRYLAEKKPALAVPEFRAVLAADPGNLDAQANFGVLLYFQGDDIGAEPLLKAAVAQKPDLVPERRSCLSK